MCHEIWEAIEEFPDYNVSTCGRIWNDRMERFLKPSPVRFDTPIVGLMSNRRQYKRSVAVLVASTFIEPVEYHPELFRTVQHLDGDRTNCHVTNLRWRTRSYAIQYHKEAQIESLTDFGLPIRCLETGDIFDSVRDAARTYGLLEIQVLKALYERGPHGSYQYNFEHLKN